MNSRIAVLVSAALVMVLNLGSGAAVAQDANAKVVVCSATRVLKQTQEYKDMELMLQSDSKAFQNEATSRKAKLTQMQTELSMFKPETKDFKQKNDDLLHASIDFEAWANVMQREEARKQKQQIRQLFDKMDTTIASIAKTRGINVVIADQRPELSDDQIEKADPNQLLIALASRTILFTDPKQDITQDVVNAMDRDYAKH